MQKKIIYIKKVKKMKIKIIKIHIMLICFLGKKAGKNIRINKKKYYKVAGAVGPGKSMGNC